MVDTSPLTVEQTLGLVFTQFEDVGKIHLFARSNPEALPQLRQIVEAEELADAHHRAWTALGYLGDQSDVERIEREISGDFEGRLTDEERLSLESMIFALGQLSDRHVEGAWELLERLESFASWRDRDLILYGGTKEYPQAYDLAIFAFHADAYAGRPGLEGRIAAGLGEIDAPEDRRAVARLLDPKSLKEAATSTHRAEDRPASKDDRDGLGLQYRMEADRLRQSGITLPDGP